MSHRTLSFWASLTLASFAAIQGACGRSNGANLTSATTDLCSADVATAVTGGGRCNWSCAGSNGGNAGSCMAAVNAASGGGVGGAGGSTGPKDPTVGLLPAASDGYKNWSVAGLNAIPLTGSISGTTLTVTYSPSRALGPGQTISGSGVASGTQITAFGTGAGGAGGYTVNNSQTVGSEAMTASGVPNRTKIYKTLSPSGGDDSSAIQTALNNCPAGQVVLLTRGVFRIDTGIVVDSSCTLRGSGPGQQLNTGLNKVGGEGTVRSCAGGDLVTYGNASFCTDSAATQIIDANRAINTGHDLIDMYKNGTTLTGNTYRLASDAVQGAYSVTLVSGPGSNIHPGDIVAIVETAENDPNVYYGPNFASHPGSQYWNTISGCAYCNLGQLLEIASVNGARVTFDVPVTYPFRTAYSAKMVLYSAQPLHGAGIENLFVWGGTNHGNIAISDCDYCWVKNVESSWSFGDSVSLTETFRGVIRDSFVHETSNPSPGGAGYLTSINTGASENLVENNIFWYGNKVNVMPVSGGGNVFAYNYTDDAFGATYPGSPEAGINAGHRTTGHLELLEGNYSHNFKGDGFWGGQIFITAFRNWISQHRAAHPPLNTYTSGGCPYGDYNGGSRAAVDLQAGSYHNNFVGNVLGMSGQQLLPAAPGCYPPQTAWMVQVTTTADWDAQQANNNVPVWQIGGEQTGSGFAFVPTMIDTITRTANWDWYTQAMHCYGAGGTTDLGCAGVVVPNSFYLASKPAFFGKNSWPWVDPTTGTTYTLPAKYCFEHDEMPTCLQ